MPSHFKGGETPARVSRYALIRSALLNCEICVAVTLTAGTSRDTHPAFASPSEWDVLMPVVSLRGPVRCRMAVHASWACNHSGHFAKNSARAHRSILIESNAEGSVKLCAMLCAPAPAVTSSKTSLQSLSARMTTP